MADIIQTAPEQGVQDNVPADLRQMMDISVKPFTGEKVDVSNFLQEQQPQQPVQQAQPTLQPPVTAQPDPAAQQPAPTAEPQQPSSFTFDLFKEKFNYQSPEEVIKEIEELRKLKDTPAPKPELKFENEASERFFKTIQAGKEDELLQYLSEKKKIEQLASAEVNNENADAIIKLGMQLEYPNLTSEMIEFQFKKQYSLPKTPVMTESETEEEFAQRQADYNEKVQDVTMSKLIAANMAKPKIESQKQNITFPTFDNTVDADYENYKKQVEESEKLNTETVEAYKQFTPEQINFKVPFSDEAAKLNFELSFQPDSESFAKAVELVSDQDKFYKTFLNADGSPNRKSFLEFVYKGLYADKMFLEAAKQGSNERMKALLPDNSGNPITRQIPQTYEQTELDKMMQVSMQVGGR